MEPGFEFRVSGFELLAQYFIADVNPAFLEASTAPATAKSDFTLTARQEPETRNAKPETDEMAEGRLRIPNSISCHLSHFRLALV